MNATHDFRRTRQHAFRRCARRFHTRRVFLPAVFGFCMLFGLAAHAQPLSGAYTIPGSFPTIAAAIAAFNANGVSGPVIFDVAAEHSEDAVNLVFTNTSPTTDNSVVFRKSGTGANPVVRAVKGGVGDRDGIIGFAGTGHVTFDGIDLVEITDSADAKTLLEWGFGIFVANDTVASQGIVIKNCTVTLHPGSLAALGCIYADSRDSTGGFIKSRTPQGVISDCAFYGNTLRNGGIVLLSYQAPAPSDIYGRNNTIGVPDGNTIYPGATSASGISSRRQDEGRIENNQVFLGDRLKEHFVGIDVNAPRDSRTAISGNAVVMGSATPCSIRAGIAVSGNGPKVVTVEGNLISGLYFGGPDQWLINGIYLSPRGDSLNVKNNTVRNVRGDFSPALTWGFGGIWNDSTGHLDMGGNTVRDIMIAGSETVYGIFDGNSGCVAHSVVHDNTIRNIVLTGSYGHLCGLSQREGALETYGNLVENLMYANPSQSGGGICGYSVGSGQVSLELHDNVFRNFSITQPDSGAWCSIAGVHIAGSLETVTTNIYRNTVYNLSFESMNNSRGMVEGITSSAQGFNNIFRNSVFHLTAGDIHGQSIGISVDDLGSTTSTVINNVYNNVVYDLHAPVSESFDAVVGLSFAGHNTMVTNLGAFNTVLLNATSLSTTLFGTSAVLVEANPRTILRNNILVNLSTPGPFEGSFAAVHRRMGTNLSTYDSTSDNNCLYVGQGPGDPKRQLYHESTTTCIDLASYKALMAPREQHSFSELPPFVNGTTPPYDLRMRTDTPTRCESGGSPVLSPPITDDFYGAPRNPLTPDVGAEEFLGIVMSVPAVADPDLTLYPNFPNPFAASTTLSFTLPRPGYTSVYVYDITGRHVKTLVAGRLGAGLNRVTLTAAGLAPGPYTYRIQSGAATKSGTMTVGR